MAGLRTSRNFAPVDKDKLTKGAHITDSSIVSLIFTFFHALTPALAQISASNPGLSDIYTDVNLQKAIKLALKLFVKSKKYGEARFALCDCPFKAKNPNLYYESLHIKYYYFF